MTDGRDRKVRLKVRRQDGADRPETSRWEEFALDWQPQMNVISALMEIQKHPVTASGPEDDARGVGVRRASKRCAASCTMLINGKVRQSCTAMVDAIAPDGRDDHARADDEVPARARSRRRPVADVRGPEEGEGVDPARRVPRARPRAAPVAGEPGGGLPALALHDVRLLPRGVPAGERAIGLHRPGGDQPGAPLQPAPERQDARGTSGSTRSWARGAIEDCGKAQNCVEVCPKEIPLVDSIAEVGRAATKRMLFGWLLK